MTFWVNGGERDYPEGLSFYDLAQKKFGSEAGKYLLAVENGRLRELFHRPRKGSEIHFLTMQDKAGFDTYRRSAVMLFFAALSNICGEETNAILHFSLGSGFYITLKGDTACSEALIQSVEEEMRRLVSLALPFRKRSVPTADAIRIFREKGQKDKVKLFRTRVASRVNIYTLDRYEDYYYGFMVHDTSAVKQFRLLPYRGGLILNLPLRTDPDVIPEFSTSGKFFDAQLQGEAWAEQQNISTVGDLNENIISGKLSDTVLTSEALQESRIAWIAEQITSRSNVKFVMVAGPSSSGKTTFSQRLCIQLTAHGRVPHYIGVDNYFKNRDEMEVLPNGKKDFEGCERNDIPSIGAFEFPEGCKGDPEPTDSPVEPDIEYNVQFNINYCLTGTQVVQIVGSLCNWNEKGGCITMQKIENCNWITMFLEGTSKFFNYKFAIFNAGKIERWEDNPNREFNGTILKDKIKKSPKGIYEACEYETSGNLVMLTCHWRAF